MGNTNCCQSCNRDIDTQHELNLYQPGSSKPLTGYKNYMAQSDSKSPFVLTSPRDSAFLSAQSTRGSSIKGQYSDCLEQSTASVASFASPQRGWVLVEDNQKAKRLSGYLDYIQSQAKNKGAHQITERINESDDEEDIASELTNYNKKRKNIIQLTDDQKEEVKSSDGFEEHLSQFTLKTEIVQELQANSSDADNISMYSVTSDQIKIKNSRRSKNKGHDQKSSSRSVRSISQLGSRSRTLKVSKQNSGLTSKLSQYSRRSSMKSGTGTSVVSGGNTIVRQLTGSSVVSSQISMYSLQSNTQVIRQNTIETNSDGDNGTVVDVISQGHIINDSDSLADLSMADPGQVDFVDSSSESEHKQQTKNEKRKVIYQQSQVQSLKTSVFNEIVEEEDENTVSHAIENRNSNLIEAFSPTKITIGDI